MSLWIYILHGYDLEADTADLPYRVTPELTQAKQDGREVGDKKGKRETEIPKVSTHGAEKYRQIVRSRASTRTHMHTCVKNDAFNNR